MPIDVRPGKPTRHGCLLFTNLGRLPALAWLFALIGGTGAAGARYALIVCRFPRAGVAAGGYTDPDKGFERLVRELVKMPVCYITERNQRMAVTVAPFMSPPEESAASEWLAGDELRLCSAEFARARAA